MPHHRAQRQHFGGRLAVAAPSEANRVNGMPKLVPAKLGGDVDVVRFVDEDARRPQQVRVAVGRVL